MVSALRAITAKQLRRRYLLALSLIAVLITASQVTLQVLISAQADDSNVINLAGRQRMLSQKIAKSSANLVQAGDLQQQELLRQELQQALQLWQQTHLGLLNGDPLLQLPGDNSRQVKALFDTIEPHYRTISEAVTHLLINATTDPDGIQEQLLRIQMHEGAFLRGMNQIVYAYADEANSRVELIRWFEVFLFSITLIVLLIEARYIFAPAANRVEQTMGELETRYRDLERLFSASPTGMLLLHAEDLTIIEGNNKICQLLGISISQRPTIDQFLDQRHDVNKDFLKRLRSGRVIDEFEIVVVSAAQSTLHMLASVRASKVRNKDVLILGFTDVSDIKKAQQVIERHATYDALTQLINRRTGLMMLDKAVANSTRHNEPLCLCFIDLDYLKQANDEYGHAEGDWLIKTVGRTLSESIRDGDTAARLGGDEFMLLLPRCDEDAGHALLQRIQQQLNSIQQQAQKPYPMELSFGIIGFSAERHGNAEVLLAEADNRMYRHKRLKRSAEATPAGPVIKPVTK